VGRAAGPKALSPPKNAAGPGAQIFAGAILPAPRSAPAPSPIRQWQAIHLHPAHDNRLRTWDAYQSFTKWAKPQGIAMTFTAFDYELQLLGVKREEAGGRTFYLNVQVTSPGAVVQLRKGLASA